MKIIAIGIIVIIVLIGGYYLFTSRSPGPTSVTAPPPEVPVAPAPALDALSAPSSSASTASSHTISMDAGGFNPSAITIKAGDTVVFKNDDTRTRWPASDIHPTHLRCPGFDALRPMQPGETYEHTFTKPEDCPMHDHLAPRLTGKVTVTP